MREIQDESPEDITARMLRRKPVRELVELLGHDNKLTQADFDFLYTHGYTPKEWFVESQDYRVSKAMKEITSGLRAHLAAKMKSKNTTPQRKP